MMKTFSFKNLLIALILFTLPFATQAQCAMCRAALMTGEDKSAAEGINHGITYLMVFPYILVVIVAFAIYRVMKKEA